MEYTRHTMDDMCQRIDALTVQLEHGGGLGPREDQAVSEIVNTIQRIGEGVAWAYGNNAGLGEEFAQPFVDRRIRDRFKVLLTQNTKMLRRDSQGRVAHQILQTIHIMLSHTPQDSTLFCYLSTGYYLNEVVSCRFDFTDNDDLMHTWLALMKEIAMMLKEDNYMLFYNPMTSDSPFPVFSEAIRFYHHHSSQVRTIVQATSLEIFAKLRTEDFWQEPQFQKILAEYFTHVCCLLRELWRMVDTNIKNRSRKDALSALRIQNDILMYVNDVFMCDIGIVSDILQEKLLHFALLPVLVRSMLRPSDGTPAASVAGEDFRLSPSVAAFMLYDALTTLRSAPVSAAVAFALLRKEVPEQVLQLIANAPPQTPRQYLVLQAAWGSPCEPSRALDAVVPDEALYRMPDVPLVQLLKSRNGQGAPAVRNTLLEHLEAVLEGLGAVSAGGGGGETAIEQAAPASPLMGVITLLLRTLRSTQEALAEEVAQRLGAGLCRVLSANGQMKWAALEGALCALRELAALVDSPIGHAQQLIGPHLEVKILQPLAAKIAKASAEGGALQEKWLDEFQEQWTAHQNTPQELPSSASLERELLDRGASEQPGAPDGRARSLRVLLCARRLNLSLNAGEHPQRLDEMPGLDEAEEKERERFQPGVPVHIGRVNRVKCVLVRAAKGGGQEVLYLISSQTLLVLVRPDEQKPFWANPVIVEPLRSVRFMMTLQEGGTVLAGGPAGSAASTAADRRQQWKSGGGPLEQIAAPGMNGDESPRALRLEVFSPCSPELQKQMQQAFAPPSRGGMAQDSMAMTMPMAPLLAGAVVPMDDRIAHSVPNVMGSIGDAHSSSSVARSTPLVLLFADERRKRVACKIFVQARHNVCQHMAAGLESFLEEVRHAK